MDDITAKNLLISQEDCDELVATMEGSYQQALDGRSFSISSKIDGDYVYVKTTLANRDQSFYYPVEARIAFQEEEVEPKEGAFLLIDYINSYFEEFLMEEEENLFLPIDWTVHRYEAVSFEIKGQILNLQVEAMADKILREYPL